MSKLSRDLALNDSHVRLDPGDTKVLHADMSLVTYSLIGSASAETRVLATPQRAGIRITITKSSGAGAITLSTRGDEDFYASGQPVDTVVLSSVGDTVEMVSCRIGTTIHWNAYLSVASNSTVTATGVAATDTAALQAALTAASDGDVLNWKGSFAVNDELTLTSTDGIKIVGRNCTITQNTTLKITLDVTTCDRFEISGVHFIGKGDETPWAGGSTSWNGVAGVRLHTCTNSSVKDNRFTNHAGGSVVIYGANTNIEVSGNLIVGTSPVTVSPNDNGADGGIHTGGGLEAVEGIRITNNDISGHCFGVILAVTGSGVVITDNNIHDITGQHGVYLAQGADCVVSNNTISDCQLIGIKLQHQTAADIECTAVISNNSVARCGNAGIGVIAAGVAASSPYYYTKNVSVVGNNIYDTFDDCIYVTRAKGILVAGNRCRKSDGGGLWFGYSDGTISNNRFEEMDAAGLYIQQPVGRVTVDGLDMVDCCINASDNTGTATHRSMLTIVGTAASTADLVSLANIRQGWERFSANDGGVEAGAALLYDLYADGNSNLVVNGPIDTGVNNECGYNRIDGAYQSTVQRVRKYTVDASAGGTAQTQFLLYAQAGMVINEVVAVVKTQFDGDTTTTLEVGASGNPDKYIDQADFDPSTAATTATGWQAMTGGGSNDQGAAEYLAADSTLVATWTNTASASAGEVDIYVTYT